MSGYSMKKGILTVLLANLTNMLFNLFINFAQPKFLSVDSYATIKSFQLYVSYIGILHFGYVDGMYLKFGGKTLQDIDKSELSRDVSTLRAFQIIIGMFCAIVSFLIKNYLLLMVALSIFPMNIGAYYKSFYQATGEYSKYGRIMNAYTITAFVLNAIMILLIRTDDSDKYIFLYLLSYIGIWLYLEIRLFKEGYIENRGALKFKSELFLGNIRNGFFLMLGNFSSNILTSIDRWFVKGLLSNADFAYYSFAVSLENFLNIAITPITITLYNFLCVNREKEKIVRIKNFVCIFAVILPIAAFPAKFILEVFLQDYFPSTIVMLCLFASQIFNIVNKSIYLNLYKAERKQNLYFKKMIGILIWGVVLNILLYIIIRNKESFALGTLLTSISWLIISYVDFKEHKMTFIQMVHLLFAAILLIVLGSITGAVVGFVTYGFIIGLTTYFLYKREIREILSSVIHKIRKVGIK